MSRDCQRIATSFAGVAEHDFSIFHNAFVTSNAGHESALFCASHYSPMRRSIRLGAFTAQAETAPHDRPSRRFVDLARHSVAAGQESPKFAERERRDWR